MAKKLFWMTKGGGWVSQQVIFDDKGGGGVSKKVIFINKGGRGAVQTPLNRMASLMNSPLYAALFSSLLEYLTSKLVFNEQNVNEFKTKCQTMYTIL